MLTLAEEVLDLRAVRVFHTVFYSSAAFDDWAKKVFSFNYIRSLPWFRGDAPGRRGTTGEEEFLPDIKARLGVQDTKEYMRRVAATADELEQIPSLEVTRERFSAAEACFEHIHPKESFPSLVFSLWHWGNLCLTTKLARIAKGIKPLIFSDVEEARQGVRFLLGQSLLGDAGLQVSDMLAFLLAMGLVHDKLFPSSTTLVHEGLSLARLEIMVQHLVFSITDPSYIQHQHGQQEQQQPDLEFEPPFYAEGQPYAEVFADKVQIYCTLLMLKLPRDLAVNFKDVFFLLHGQARVDQILRWSTWCFNTHLETLRAVEEGHYPHDQAVIPGVDDIPLGGS